MSELLTYNPQLFVSENIPEKCKLSHLQKYLHIKYHDADPDGIQLFVI
jgi:hypothetical protein